MSRATLDFDSLASAYDAWFDEEGKLIFAIEAKAFQEVLPLLPRPWLEVGVGSGRFAQALGIETGIDPSAKLLALRHHPDRNPHDRKQAEERFKKVNEAYQVLSDEARRRQCDYLISQPKQRRRVFITEDIFSGSSASRDILEELLRELATLRVSFDSIRRRRPRSCRRVYRRRSRWFSPWGPARGSEP